MRRTVGLAVALLAVWVYAPVAASADQVRNQQWYLSPLGVERAWKITQGAGVTVCVIDSGIDATIPDLRGAVVGSKRFTKYVNSEGLVTSHGTGVAALLAGRGHGKGAGVVGVAPRAHLLSAVVDEDDPNFAQQANAAIRWCTNRGAGVINMSLADQQDAGFSAAVTYARSKNVVVVAASGNTFQNLKGNSLHYPAVLPGVVAVTGIDENLHKDGSALTSSTGKPVSIAAPESTTDGTNGYPRIGLPAAEDHDTAAQGKPYDLHAVGTSLAAPIVAGVAALIRSVHPTYNADAVINTLLATATPHGGKVPNRTYGYGIVNAYRAVTADLPNVKVNPLISGKVVRTAASHKKKAHRHVEAAALGAGGAAVVLAGAGIAWRARRTSSSRSG